MKTATSLRSLAIATLASLTVLFSSACGPSLASMHQQAESGNVQADAPLHARQSVTIHAPRERVFEILSGFSSWPRWQPNIKKVTPPASLTAGESFGWTNETAEITSKLAVVRPGEMLGWTGSVSTAKAIHIWRLSSPTPDTTRVDVEETMDGFLLTWFYGQKDLDAEMARSLDNLNKAAEAPAPR